MVEKKILWYPPAEYPEHNKPKSLECLGNQEFDSSLLIQLDNHKLSIPHKLEHLPQMVGCNDTRPTWIYWRELGVFFIDGMGSHPCAMAMLWEYKNRQPRPEGQDDSDYELDWYNCEDPDEYADKFLMETPGTAYLSSLMGTVRAGKPEYLTTHEKRLLGGKTGNIKYLNERWE